MILTVIIVSYNVKFFLEQCLSSLKKAIDGNPAYREKTEVFVIDNSSSDSSLEFLIPLFPGVQFIQNKENPGFAKANNQALAKSSGEFILFLNPDTILAEDSLEICLSFFGSTPDAGAIGVRMIDGCGKYLKESKRGYPSPSAAFYKMIGLSRFFPRSKTFSAYYMGHLDERFSHPVDVLSGAFLMVRKTVIQKTGGFDEQFFMYGEDIDLSWRIKQSGFLNYYLPDTTIIHFKGESTPKDKHYVSLFYAAMETFMKKHFKTGISSLQVHIIKVGIRLHQSLAYIRLPFKRPLVKKSPFPSIFIKGDTDLQQKWKSRLSRENILVKENENDADEVIYCEGPGMSWKSIIDEVSKNKKQISFKFQGFGTHAAVGSDSSRDQGMVLLL